MDKVFTNSNLSESAHDISGFNYICDRYGIIGREQDIVRMLIKGLVHKEIASCMHLSKRAVEYHITKIYKKCDVKNKFDLLEKFQR